jgi:hypothetical protein
MTHDPDNVLAELADSPPIAAQQGGMQNGALAHHRIAVGTPGSGSGGGS